MYWFTLLQSSGDKMINKIMKLVEETFDEEVSSEIDANFGSPYSYLTGEDAFYKSLKEKLEKFLSEEDSSKDLDQLIEKIDHDVDSLIKDEFQTEEKE